jgi:hypothetical protein
MSDMMMMDKTIITLGRAGEGCRLSCWADRPWSDQKLTRVIHVQIVEIIECCLSPQG